MIEKRHLFLFLSYMLVITSLLPVLSENLPVGLGSFRYFWAPLWLISLVLFEIKVFLHKSIFPFLLYGLFLLIFIPTVWFNMDDWFINLLAEEIYWMITICTVTYYYVKNEDHKGLAQLASVSLICIGITAIFTIVGSFINPMYARLFIQSARTGYADTAEGTLIRRLGAGMYSFGQSVICLFPILIYYLKRKISFIFPKWMLFGYLILLFIAIVRMQFFANIILAATVIGISFIGSKHIQFSALVVGFVIVFAFVIPKSFYVNLLISASEYFEPGSENYDKLTDMATYLKMGESAKTGVAGRLDRYPLLYDAFVKKPLFGNSASSRPEDISLGYHLHWMGKLGATGILGILLFFAPHFLFVKRWLNEFDINYVFFATISFVAFFFLGLMKVIAGRDIWFTYFFLIPGLYYLPWFIEKNNTNQDS